MVQNKPKTGFGDFFLEHWCISFWLEVVYNEISYGPYAPLILI
jgi:hypothetical protein